MYDFVEVCSPAPGEERCDFCSAPCVAWTYPCRSHAQKTMLAAPRAPDGSLHDRMLLDGFSGGNWAACEVCHALIERGLRDKLARRSAKRLIRSGVRMGLGNAIATVRTLHDQFWTNREGAPYRHV